MSIFEALILGIVQGITEFLPVSSSGHLKLMQILFGMKNLHHYVAFDLICHLGTLLAIVVIMYRRIWSILTCERKMILKIIVALLPLMPIYFILDPLKNFMSRPELLGFFFLGTALLLFLGDKLRVKISSQDGYVHPFIIGIFQAFALCPGVSRSAATISAARMLGWKWHSALEFSFIILIPTILGGSSLEFYKLFSQETPSHISFLSYIIGFVASFAVGVGALSWLMRQAKETIFRYFGWYCLVLGIGCIVGLNIW